MIKDNFWEPRRCLLPPIPEIYKAAEILNDAVDAHLAGRKDVAEELIYQADIPAIAEWTETLWGAVTDEVHRVRKPESMPPLLSNNQKIKARMPTIAHQRMLIKRDGYNCRYCGIPVIDAKVRKAICLEYPKALRWGQKNGDQHAAFQCMWLTYEHVLPHCRGGDNSFENMIISCQPCNCGKMDMTLEEVGLIDPRTVPFQRSEWDGLQRFIGEDV